MIENTNYRFERFGIADLSIVQRLIRVCFGSSVKFDELYSKYDTQTLGSEVVGVIAFDHLDIPVSFYGVFPIRLKSHGQSYLIAQSGDTMTVPAHHRRGLFVETAKRTYEIASEKGIKFIFGFPNEKSYPGFKGKLGWHFVGFMYDFTIDTDCFPLAALCKKVPILSSLCRFVTNRLSLISVELSTEIIRGFDFENSTCVLRDQYYLEYKLRRGARIVRWEGFIIFVKVDGVLLVGEVVRFDDSLCYDFVGSVGRLGRYLLCHRVVLSLSAEHWLFVSLKNTGMQLSTSLPIGFLHLDEAPFNYNQISFSRLDYDTF